MAPASGTTQPGEICTLSWMLWASSAAEAAAVREEVDRIFGAFSFYPEVEWGLFGYRPLDGHKVLGAWRHPDGVAFVFLTDNPGMAGSGGMTQLVLSYAGAQHQLEPLRPLVRRLKNELARKNGRQRSDRELQARLANANQFRFVGRLIGLMTLITAVINGLALYLKKLGAPPPGVPWILRAYQTLLPLVYVSALLSLFAFALVCVAYICKYGFLLLRRL